MNEGFKTGIYFAKEDDRGDAVYLIVNGKPIAALYQDSAIIYGEETKDGGTAYKALMDFLNQVKPVSAEDVTVA